jgi:uncharacterized protein (TIRG00374 family)
MTTDVPSGTQGPAPRPAAGRPAGRRRRVLGRVAHAVLFAALTAGVFGLLPRLGGVAHDAAELRQARPGFIVAAVVAQAASLASYALLYRSVQVSLGGRLGFPLAARVVLATFLVSHLTPFGSVTGTLVNVNAMESAGIPAATTGEAVALSSLVSTLALIALFGAGLIATAGHVATVYLLIAGAALVIAGAALAAALALGAHPAAAGRAGRWAAGLLRRLRPGTDPARVASSWQRLATAAKTALSGRDFLRSFCFAAADLLFDLLSLGLMFGALGSRPGFGPLAVAYAAANIASAIPITPGGLGVIEVTLVAVTAGFGVPRATAVLAVLGYRLVNYWLPLPVGAVAYLRLRLSARKGAAAKAGPPAAGPPAGGPAAGGPAAGRTA